MKFSKVSFGNGLFYWTWRDLPFLPYAWLEEKDLEKLPIPFFLDEIHPDCKIGFESEEKDNVTNIIGLDNDFEALKIDSDLRKDLKRIENKNLKTKLVFNEKNAMDNSKRWFLELWNEEKEDFERRILLWKKYAYTISAYSGKELIGVHIAIEGEETVYYLGCWWNRKYKSLAVPTFLLKKDIEMAIEKKKKFYDLGIGGESYKKKWGVIEKPTKYYAVLTKKLAEMMVVDVKRYILIESH